MPGSITSSTMRSGRCSRSSFRPSSPLAAVATRCPWRVSESSRAVRMASSSSISNREGTGSFWPMRGLSFDLWVGGEAPEGDGFRGAGRVQGVGPIPRTPVPRPYTGTARNPRTCGFDEPEQLLTVRGPRCSASSDKISRPSPPGRRCCPGPARNPPDIPLSSSNTPGSRAAAVLTGRPRWVADDEIGAPGRGAVRRAPRPDTAPEPPRSARPARAAGRGPGHGRRRAG